MKITHLHPASSYGVPVILDDQGQPMDYAPGIKAVRDRLGLKNQDLADRCGVSRRTLEGWLLGKPPSAAALNVMSALI